MFENFPYTDMHQLNLDWIIKIAKDFLDQYTHLQQLISDGEASLQNLTDEGVRTLVTKTDQLETLLNEWYETHSADIANQLAAALADIASTLSAALGDINTTKNTAISIFQQSASSYAQDTIDSIPSDYTSLFNQVQLLDEFVNKMRFYPPLYFQQANILRNLQPKVGYYVTYTTGVEEVNASYQYYIVPVEPGLCYTAGANNTHIAFFDADDTFISGKLCNANHGQDFTPPAGTKYATYSCAISSVQWAVIPSAFPIVENNSPIAALANTELTLFNAHRLLKTGKNLFNKDYTIDGGFIDYTSKGSYNANSEYCFCPWFIPAKASTTYCRTHYAIISEFDKDLNYITVHNLTTVSSPTTFTTDATCAYIRISGIALRKNILQIEEGSTPTGYEPFKLYGIGHTGEDFIVVSKDGTGDFTTINDAVSYAKDGDTIYIHDGTYEESIINNDKLLHLVGESQKNTVIKYTGTNYATPPLEMAKGSIKNMTIWATTYDGAPSGGGYCLHCDNNNSKGFYMHCENVTFRNDHHQSVGIGLRPDFEISFVNCKFINQVYCHDSNTVYANMKDQRFTMIGCSVLASTDYYGAIRMQSQEKPAAVATATFRNNVVVNQGLGGALTMSLWSDPGLAKNAWLGSSDWYLDETSALNNSAIINN